MDVRLKKPPKDKSLLTSLPDLTKKLEPLINTEFKLTGKSRTDGSNIRKLIADKLINSSPPLPAEKNSYEVVPSKGVPKILLEYVDTYIVATGTSYNLQVWNRNPSSESVQIQDSPTVDLGKFSPEFEINVPDCANFTTRNMRYFIALTNPETNIVEGAVLCQGNKLGLHFTYVSEESYKCQRSIPMSFFAGIQGLSVFNP